MAKVCKKSFAEDFSSVTFKFADEAETTLEINVEELSEETISRALAHGLSQKIGDSYSGVDTVAAAIEAARKVINELLAGNWSAPRATGESGGRITQLAAAVARVAGRTVEEAQELIENLSEEQVKALKKSPEIKVAIARIKQEKAEADLAKAGDQPSLADLLRGSTAPEAAGV